MVVEPLLNSVQPGDVDFSRKPSTSREEGVVWRSVLVGPPLVLFWGGGVINRYYCRGGGVFFGGGGVWGGGEAPATSITWVNFWELWGRGGAFPPPGSLIAYSCKNLKAS